MEAREATYDVRPFTIAWHTAAYRLWDACDGVGLCEADSREAIDAYLRRNPGMSFVAVAGQKLVGTVLCGHDGRRGYIHHLAVAPGWRRRGVGRSLVRRSLATLAEAGIRRCHGFVFEDNPEGLAFWEAGGWTLRTELQLISKDVPQADP